MKAATGQVQAPMQTLPFQSTPPVKAATTALSNSRSSISEISIHAAREGGDYVADNSVRKRFGISIHAAREGGDARPNHPQRPNRISIHAAREGGDPTAGAETPRQHISIHAAREGGDRDAKSKGKAGYHFNPRRP